MFIKQLSVLSMYLHSNSNAIVAMPGIMNTPHCTVANVADQYNNVSTKPCGTSKYLYQAPVKTTCRGDYLHTRRLYNQCYL